MLSKLIRNKHVLINKYYLLSYLDLYVKKTDMKSLKILSDEETINYIENNKVSFLRWGDGDSNIVTGFPMVYQKYSKELKNDLLEILSTKYSETNFLLGIPYDYIKGDASYFYSLDKRKIKLWYRTRYLISYYKNNKDKYGNAFIFRPEGELSRREVSRLWKNKNILIISSDKNHVENIKNNDEVEDVYHIEIVKEDCYDDKNIIIEKSLSILSSHSKHNILVLIAGGPAGKVIGYNLIKKGYQVIDIGHFFTWKGKSK